MIKSVSTYCIGYVLIFKVIVFPMKILLNLKFGAKFQQGYPLLYLRSTGLFCFSFVSPLLKLLCCPFQKHELIPGIPDEK